MTGLRSRLHTLPLPLAQLVQRAVNSKSSVERHHNAYYLAECTLKLAASARIGAWLALTPGKVSDSPLAQRLQCLTLPSTGHWLELLRDTSAALGGRVDADLLPVVPDHELTAPRQWDAVKRLARTCVSHEVVSQEVASRASTRGLLGFFDLVVTYRNQVLGHGAQRASAFYDELAGVFFDALEDVLSGPALIIDGYLAQARLELASGGARAQTRWYALEGLAGLMRDTDARDAQPGKLYLVTPRGAVLLEPLVVYEQQEELGRERVGFLNRTVRRARAGGESDVRRVEYLDYATGQTLATVDSRAAVTELLGRLQGRAVTAGDLERAMEAADVEASVPSTASSAAQAETIGDFTLLSELGRGAMGVVYKARHTTLGRIVALKVLSTTLAGDDAARKRFEREIRALARCDHPNVVKILSSGVDGDRAYYAMEFVEGSDLGEATTVISKWRGSVTRLTEQHLAAAASAHGKSIPPPDRLPSQREAPPLRPLPTRLAELFAEAADGLAHIHEQGILHRDLKPGNLMLTSDGKRIVIMDLGLAKLRDESRALTSADVKILGTLRYMAPEQLQRQFVDLDERVDIYGLGAALYEVATGRPPFDGDTEQRLIQQVLNEDPPPPRVVEPSLPRDLSSVIEVALSKQRERRYRTAGDLAADLRAVALNHPIRARPPGALHRLALWSRRHRAIVAVLATAAPLTLVAVWALGRTGAGDDAFLIDRFEDEVDVRDWVPYTDTNAKTSPVRRHSRLSVRRVTTTPLPFEELASTMSPLGLDCVSHVSGADCEEVLPSPEPPRRSWMMRVGADQFARDRPTIVEYALTYWNSFRFDLGEHCTACDVQNHIIYPVKDYSLTIHFTKAMTWKRVHCQILEPHAPAPEVRENSAGDDVFTFKARDVAAGATIVCHIYVNQ